MCSAFSSFLHFKWKNFRNEDKLKQLYIIIHSLFTLFGSQCSAHIVQSTSPLMPRTSAIVLIHPVYVFMVHQSYCSFSFRFVTFLNQGRTHNSNPKAFVFVSFCICFVHTYSDNIRILFSGSHLGWIDIYPAISSTLPICVCIFPGNFPGNFPATIPFASA